MARYGTKRYQLGPYWLGQRDGSPAWYRCWSEGKQVRRSSMGTADFLEAKRLFDAWWVENIKLESDDLPPSRVKLSDVLDDYMANHANKLRSHETCRIFCRYWKEWWGDASVADVRNIARQEGFRAHLTQKGLGPNSVARCLEIGRAAIRRAWKRGVVSNFPHVEIPTVGETAPKGRPLTVEDIGKLLGGTVEPHLHLFSLLLLATGARPEAVLELTWGQIDFENDLIRLNPEGRKQTSKRRPVVKLPPVLKQVLRDMEGAPADTLIQFRGKSIGKVDSGWHKMVKLSGLSGNVTPYSFRHTVARWLRQHGVPPWEVAAQLGHSLPQFTMSERYAAHSPDYLTASVKAIDSLLGLVLPASLQILASAKKSKARPAA